MSHSYWNYKPTYSSKVWGCDPLVQNHHGGVTLKRSIPVFWQKITTSTAEFVNTKKGELFNASTVHIHWDKQKHIIPKSYPTHEKVITKSLLGGIVVRGVPFEPPRSLARLLEGSLAKWNLP